MAVSPEREFVRKLGPSPVPFIPTSTCNSFGDLHLGSDAEIEVDDPIAFPFVSCSHNHSQRPAYPIIRKDSEFKSVFQKDTRKIARARQIDPHRLLSRNGHIGDMSIPDYVASEADEY